MMTTKRKAPAPEPATPPPAEPVVDIDTSRIVQRPDGYFWLCEDRHHETGPFDTFDDALADMMRAEQPGTEPGESLQEAEAEIGIADWVDPETQEPAEEERPRLEDH
jgi:hypothetical protein